VGATKRGKGTKLMAVADSAGLPLAIYTSSAAPHEVRLVEQTLCARFTDERPRRLIGDKAYDSDPLDEKLAAFETELIAPHKANRKRAKTQDGRKLRRYKRRWKIERLFAWLQNFRRVLVRFDYHDANYLGFVHLACIVILLRNYF
jgi:transposase